MFSKIIYQAAVHLSTFNKKSQQLMTAQKKYTIINKPKHNAANSKDQIVPELR